MNWKEATKMSDITQTSLQSRLDALARIVGGKSWGLDRGKPRIYLPSAKDRKIFISFEDFDGAELAGAKLQIFIDDCGQSPKWYSSQKRVEIKALRHIFLAITMAINDEDMERGLRAAAAIIALDEELSDDQINQAAHESANGRAEDAYEILGIVV
jgi:hypothetical protein